MSEPVASGERVDFSPYAARLGDVPLYETGTKENRVVEGETEAVIEAVKLIESVTNITLPGGPGGKFHFLAVYLDENTGRIAARELRG